jgi:hypothetical protein
VNIKRRIKEDKMTREVTHTLDGYPQVILGQGELTVDAWGRQKVSEDYSMFHGMFTYDIPPSMWLLYENGTELLTLSSSTRNGSVDGALSITSGAVTGDISLLTTRRHPRYQPNRGLLYSSSVFLPNPTQGQVDFGLFVEEADGCFFRRKEDGKLYACVRSGGVLTHEEEVSLPHTFNLAMGNTYDIQAQWRGVGNIRFYVGDPRTSFSTLAHTISNLNKSTALIMQNPALAISFRATNISGQEASLKCGCVDLTSEGGNVEQEQYLALEGTNTVSSGDPILAIRSPELIHGRHNTRDTRFVRVRGSSDKKVKLAVYSTRDATTLVGGTWSAPTGGFYNEINATLTSVTTASMNFITSFYVGANTTGFVDSPSELINFHMVHGDSLVLVCEEGSIATVQGIFELGVEI